tara:strand:+ start:3184 stop:4182 length:999 start_codon:yes stop_codon:yes gene_type:complete
MPGHVQPANLRPVQAPSPYTAFGAADAVALCIKPGNGDPTLDSFCSWLLQYRVWLTAQLHHFGALLFTGFALTDANTFARAANILLGAEPQPYIGGDSPRTRLRENIYTSTDFPSRHEIRLHNELSYGSWWPDTICFFCVTPSITGGATQIADGRRILELLPDATRERFARLGVCYQQNLPDSASGTGLKSWQETFDTEERRAVEQICTNGGMTWEWSGEGLKTSIVRPAIVEHPLTGQPAWFNQADHWHALTAGVKNAFAAEHGAAPTTHATYGDGVEIDASELAMVQSICQQCEFTRPWRQGDLLVLDNHLTLHGRKPFTGAREILVAMA